MHESSKDGDPVGIVTCEAILIEVVCDEYGISFLYVITLCASERVDEAAKRSEKCQSAGSRKRT